MGYDTILHNRKKITMVLALAIKRLKSRQIGEFMKNTIVFRIAVNDEESYGVLANFIYKREQHLELTSEEVRFVTYKYYLSNSYEFFGDWAKAVSADASEFFPIKQPENIKNITEKYEVVYCLCVQESTSIVDIHNLFLIKHYYNKLKILVTIQNP